MRLEFIEYEEALELEEQGDGGNLIDKLILPDLEVRHVRDYQDQGEAIIFFGLHGDQAVVALAS